MLNVLQARTKMNQVTIILHVLLSSLFDYDIMAKQDKAKILEFPSEKKNWGNYKSSWRASLPHTCSPKEVKVQSRQKQVKISRSAKEKTLRDFKECLKCLFNNSQKLSWQFHLIRCFLEWINVSKAISSLEPFSFLSCLQTYIKSFRLPELFEECA